MVVAESLPLYSPQHEGDGSQRFSVIAVGKLLQAALLDIRAKRASRILGID
jgi:hypothetical protein